QPDDGQAGEVAPVGVVAHAVLVGQRGRGRVGDAERGDQQRARGHPQGERPAPAHGDHSGGGHADPGQPPGADDQVPELPGGARQRPRLPVQAEEPVERQAAQVPVAAGVEPGGQGRVERLPGGRQHPGAPSAAIPARRGRRRPASSPATTASVTARTTVPRRCTETAYPASAPAARPARTEPRRASSCTASSQPSSRVGSTASAKASPENSSSDGAAPAANAGASAGRAPTASRRSIRYASGNAPAAASDPTTTTSRYTVTGSSVTRWAGASSSP